MMRQYLLPRADESVIDMRSVMCLFWDLEAAGSTMYEQMAACETNPLRAEAWRKLQNFRLLRGEGRANHKVYLGRKLLLSCRETVQLGQLDCPGNPDPLRLMAAIMQLKSLQVMLVASLRQQVSVITMIDVEKFSSSVAYVTDLVLTSRAC